VEVGLYVLLDMAITTTNELRGYIDGWINDDIYNDKFFDEMCIKVDCDEQLKRHRIWIADNGHGFGDTAFHYIWKMLVESMGDEFKFLEIGVYKGQVLSLVSMLAGRYNKRCEVYGVTMLSNGGDRFSVYDDNVDYRECIDRVRREFGVNDSHMKLIVGKSNEVVVVEEVKKKCYDIVYIDGSHNYDDVVSDILNYSGVVKVGGYLVMDDCSIGRIRSGKRWQGHIDVANAVRGYLDVDDRYMFRFACGHLNVFERIK
jgi:hypothetical protein